MVLLIYSTTYTSLIVGELWIIRELFVRIITSSVQVVLETLGNRQVDPIFG